MQICKQTLNAMLGIFICPSRHSIFHDLFELFLSMLEKHEYSKLDKFLKSDVIAVFVQGNEEEYEGNILSFVTASMNKQQTKKLTGDLFSTLKRIWYRFF